MEEVLDNKETNFEAANNTGSECDVSSCGSNNGVDEHRNRVVALRPADALDAPLHLTEIPKQFLLEPGAAGVGVGIGTRQLVLKDKTEAAQRSWPRFRVPVDRPLPRAVWSPSCRRRRPSQVESYLAPLFTASGNEEEKATLSFLHPPEGNPRQVVEERKRQEMSQRWVDAEGNPRLSVAEVPIRVPNLKKKVPKDFVPQCALVFTQSRMAEVEETRKRQAEIAELSSKRLSRQMRDDRFSEERHEEENTPMA
ncbi:uncharacterized protein TEOVI_000839000 [Trypanosoma equiperdum]|uniref:Uncharacterized protein n=2 Tax=Trypanozoon TaxID=39700 RepID=Q4GYP2_TRYB2|nr:hypothetical protein, conserved [Trypanosoma brucei brucei TREU927]CAJ16542.1 hypothetical protein, conserved [Trypanosoma brucei brucei TREU927]SCU67468.1 hypothetical protein, conserved [Trypanosoma equiperdum]